MYELQDLHFWHVLHAAIYSWCSFTEISQGNLWTLLPLAHLPNIGCEKTGLTHYTGACCGIWAEAAASSFGRTLNSGQLGALPSFKGNALLLGCWVAFCLPGATSQLPALLQAWFTYNLAGELLCGPPKRLLTPGRSYFKMLLWQYNFSLFLFLVGNSFFSTRRKIDHPTIFPE